MKKWRVWFEQVNQSVYDVKADSREEAIKKAEKEWRRENSYPELGHVEEEEG